MAFFEIVHTSQATPDLPPEAVAEFLDKACERNRRMVVTGIMVHRQRAFMQLLDGEPSVAPEPRTDIGKAPTVQRGGSR